MFPDYRGGPARIKGAKQAGERTTFLSQKPRLPIQLCRNHDTTAIKAFAPWVCTSQLLCSEKRNRGQGNSPLTFPKPECTSHSLPAGSPHRTSRDTPVPLLHPKEGCLQGLQRQGERCSSQRTSKAFTRSPLARLVSPQVFIQFLCQRQQELFTKSQGSGGAVRKVIHEYLLFPWLESLQ